MSALRGFARCVGWTGLTAVGALHLVWASGSAWPAKNRKRLAESVVGNAKALPEGRATAIVGGLALAGGAVAAGALGEGRIGVGARRLMGAGLLARAAVGGDTALAVLELPAPGKRFRELDRQYYRPLCTVLGLALLVGARRAPKRAAAQPR